MGGGARTVKPGRREVHSPSTMLHADGFWVVPTRLKVPWALSVIPLVVFPRKN